MVGEGLAISSPLQCGVTLLLVWVPVDKSCAVHLHARSDITPQSGRATTGFKFWWFGALQLCAKTYVVIHVSMTKAADNMYTATAGGHTETKYLLAVVKLAPLCILTLCFCSLQYQVLSDLITCKLGNITYP